MVTCLENHYQYLYAYDNNVDWVALHMGTFPNVTKDIAGSVYVTAPPHEEMKSRCPSNNTNRVSVMDTKRARGVEEAVEIIRSCFHVFMFSGFRPTINAR